MIPGEKYKTQLGLWAVILLSVFAWAPATYPGYWQGVEGFLSVFNVSSNGAVADIGLAPDLWRGLGRGTFLFVRPLTILGVSATTAVRLNFIIAIMLGGLGTYAWLRPTLGDRAAGLAGLLYMYMPPLLATVYIRGNLSDALVMGLFPVLMAGIQTYAEERSPSGIGVIVLSQLWLWRIQPGLAAFVTLFALCYVLIVEWPLLVDRQPWLLVTVAVSGAAGLSSLIPLWSIQAAPPIPFGDHFVYFFQLFRTDWAVKPSIPGWEDAYPFQLGFAIFGFGAFALWSWWQFRVKNAPFSRFMAFVFITGVVMVALSLNIAKPLWQLTQAERLLTYPWQILLIAALPLTALAGSLVALNVGLQNRVYWAGLVLLVILSSHSFLTTQFTEFQPAERPAATFGQNQELLLLDARVTHINEDSQAQIEIAWQALRPMDFDYNIFFQGLVEKEGSITVVGQADSQPVQGTRPATTWEVGEILTDTYQIDISQHANPREIQYIFGYYNWESGARLPAVDGATGIRDDKLVLYGQ